MFLWVFIVLMLGILALTLFYIELDDQLWLFYLGVGLIGAFLLRLGIQQIVKLAGYSSYKKWCNEPGIPLSGWDEIGSFPNWPKATYWNKKVTLSIDLSNDDVGIKKEVNSALKHFVESANNSFYTAGDLQVGSTGDPRMKWHFNHPLSVSGAADGPVMGHLYFLLSKEIKAIHQKHGAIAAASISFHQDIRRVNTVDIPAD